MAGRIFMEKSEVAAPFPVSYLWQWRAEEDGVGEVIYNLKQAPVEKAHRRLAGWLLQSHELGAPELIVYPSKNLAVKDHAHYLAHAAAELLGAPAEALLIEAREDYRQLGRGDRYRLRRAKRRPGSLKRVLFVDDVYTTGATAFAVWVSLGKPRGFRAAVLAYKRLEALTAFTPTGGPRSAEKFI